MPATETVEFIKRFVQDEKPNPLEALRISGTAICAVGEHWIYVRQLRHHDEAILIVSAEDQFCSNWCVVLAIGPKVGAKRRWPAGKRKLHEVPLHVDNSFKVGDVVFVPDTFNWTVKRSVDIEEVGDNCFFVDEYTPLCRYTGEGTGHGNIKQCPRTN